MHCLHASHRSGVCMWWCVPAVRSTVTGAHSMCARISATWPSHGAPKIHPKIGSKSDPYLSQFTTIFGYFTCPKCVPFLTPILELFRGVSEGCSSALSGHLCDLHIHSSTHRNDHIACIRPSHHHVSCIGVFMLHHMMCVINSLTHS